MIEIFAWCATREMFVTGMTETLLPDGRPLATLSEDGRLIPVEGVYVDEIGPIVKTPATYDEEGNELTPAVMIPGHHVNLAAHGQIERMLISGPPDQDGNVTELPQFAEDGTLLGLFVRTNVLGLIPGMEWAPITAEGVPEGYEGPNGVRLFDPKLVKNRTRVWL